MHVFYASILLFFVPFIFTPSDANRSRIIGGTNVTNRSAFAYQASLRDKLNNHYCGGVLIKDQYVLTSAHCYDMVNGNITVVLGDLHLVKEDNNTAKYLVNKMLKHVQYKEEVRVNDIALIKLAQKVKISPEVKPISIWNSKKDVYNQTNCVVSGWGVTKANGNQSSAVLQAATIPIVKPELCKTLNETTNRSGMICAGDSGGKDSCKGDSGGPLVCENELVGLVSWGPTPCAEKGYPGVYTYVSDYTSWIDESIKKLDNNLATQAITCIYMNFITILVIFFGRL